jgi:nucleoside-diphosphate-sugar epimerase
MRLLIVGHEGYIGAGLCGYLGLAHQVVGWSKTQDVRKLRLDDLKANRIQAVINCSVVFDRVTRSYDITSPSDEVNVGGARHLAEVLRGTDIAWIQISTKDVYGNGFPRHMVRETKYAYRPRQLWADDQGFAPETVYGKSKLMAELISESHHASCVIRLSSCYTDDHHRHPNWMVRFIEGILDHRPLTVTHNGKQFRDPLHVHDLGRLIERVLAKKAFGRKLNAGGGRDNVLSLLEFIRLVDRHAQIRFAPGGDFGFAFSNDGAERAVGWRPRILLRERLPLLIENLRKQRAVRREEGP